MTEWRAWAANAPKGMVAAAEHRREQVVETGSSAALTPRFTCKRAAPEEGERPPHPTYLLLGTGASCSREGLGSLYMSWDSRQGPRKSALIYLCISLFEQMPVSSHSQALGLE